MIGGLIPSGDWDQWVPGDLSLRVKLPEREADHSLPSSTEVKECVELYLHFPNTTSWRSAHLKNKHSDNNFILTFNSCLSTTEVEIKLTGEMQR
jgi:hypothetical protein